MSSLFFYLLLDGLQFPSGYALLSEPQGKERSVSNLLVAGLEYASPVVICRD